MEYWSDGVMKLRIVLRQNFTTPLVHYSFLNALGLSRFLQ